MEAPVTMRAAVQQYLTLRRSLGFELAIEGGELQRFGRFADESGHRGPMTTDLAVRWATLPPVRVDRVYHARRLDLVRRLARHRALLDPATEIPPEGLLGPSYRRREPYIYSESEIAALLSMAAKLGPAGGLRPHTYGTLFGLLACTGLRISEALALTREHVDLEEGIVTVVAGKFRRSRLVPLHASTVQKLREYSDRRDQYHRNPCSDSFFLSEFGTRVTYRKAQLTFADLRRGLGWTRGRGGRLPRIHDMRHTVVVRRILTWYQEGADIDCKIASLSTYLGHTKVSNTYWYMTALPELMAVCAARFEQFAGRANKGEAS